MVNSEVEKFVSWKTAERINGFEDKIGRYRMMLKTTETVSRKSVYKTSISSNAVLSFCDIFFTLLYLKENSIANPYFFPAIFGEADFFTTQ